MIYLDTSVALAHLLGETFAPPASLWDDALVSSRTEMAQSSSARSGINARSGGSRR